MITDPLATATAPKGKIPIERIRNILHLDIEPVGKVTENRILLAFFLGAGEIINQIEESEPTPANYRAWINRTDGQDEVAFDHKCQNEYPTNRHQSTGFWGGWVSAVALLRGKVST